MPFEDLRVLGLERRQAQCRYRHRDGSRYSDAE
jgi:hypothetical protein